MSRAPGQTIRPGKVGGWEVPHELFKEGETQSRPGLVTRLSDPRRPSLHWGHFSKCPLLIYGPPGGTEACCGGPAHHLQLGSVGWGPLSAGFQMGFVERVPGELRHPSKDWLVSEGL